MDSGSERQKFCVREISVTLGTSTSPVPSLSFSRVLETGKKSLQQSPSEGRKMLTKGGATTLLEVTGPAQS